MHCLLVCIEVSLSSIAKMAVAVCVSCRKIEVKLLIGFKLQPEILQL